jgi:calcium/calmodulin-dependent protein kinase I
MLIQEKVKETFSKSRFWLAFHFIHFQGQELSHPSRYLKKEKRIGKTSSSEVFLAFDNRTNKKIVLKRVTICKEKSKLIENEIRAGKLLRHKNIVKMFGCYQEDQYIYLQMEYVRGMDLFEYMYKQNFRPFPEDQARKLFAQLISAVKYCHKTGIAHLDIKVNWKKKSHSSW